TPRRVGGAHMPKTPTNQHCNPPRTHYRPSDTPDIKRPLYCPSRGPYYSNTLTPTRALSSHNHFTPPPTHLHHTQQPATTTTTPPTTPRPYRPPATVGAPPLTPPPQRPAAPHSAPQHTHHTPPPHYTPQPRFSPPPASLATNGVD